MLPYSRRRRHDVEGRLPRPSRLRGLLRGDLRLERLELPRQRAQLARRLVRLLGLLDAEVLLRGGELLEEAAQLVAHLLAVLLRAADDARVQIVRVLLQVAAQALHGPLADFLVVHPGPLLQHGEVVLHGGVRRPPLVARRRARPRDLRAKRFQLRAHGRHGVVVGPRGLVVRRLRARRRAHLRRELAKFGLDFVLLGGRHGAHQTAP